MMIATVNERVGKPILFDGCVLRVNQLSRPFEAAALLLIYVNVWTWCFGTMYRVGKIRVAREPGLGLARQVHGHLPTRKFKHAWINKGSARMRARQGPNCFRTSSYLPFVISLP